MSFESVFQERAEKAIDATNENLKQGNAELAQVTATVAVANALLAIRDQLYDIGIIPSDQR